MKKAFVFISGVWILVVLFSLAWNLSTSDKNREITAREGARAFFQQAVITRKWNAGHGGVYVPVTDEVRPNPYLKVPNRDVTTTGGAILTKINPAFMTRQIAEIARESTGAQFHITSLNPIRPKNKADNWEAEALNSFESGKKEYSRFVKNNSEYRYMAPLITNKVCLKCHAAQGYKEGDIRGGISIVLPIDSKQFATGSIWISHIVAGLLGLVAIAALSIVSGRNRKQIIKAKDDAEAVAEAKADFLSNMSHEIRTPMNGVIGMAEQLFESELTETQKDQVETILHSADSLLTIINDILDFSKIEAGKLTMESVPFNFQKVVDRIGQILQRKADKKGVEFLVRYDPAAPVRLKGDATRLQQVLINLLGNAIKFTSKGHVLLNVDCKDQTAQSATMLIKVVDTGIGLSDEAQKIIFSRFDQADSSITRQFGGTGLGLSISSQLVKKMGGELKVSSQPGVGSTFYFTIQLSRDTSEGSEETDISLDLTDKKTLVVDDNDVARQIILEYLTSWNIPCSVAESGREALQLLKAAARIKQPFSIGIIDYHMSGMDGVELASIIKSKGELEDTKLLFLSSETIDNIEEKGFSAKLSKPIRSSDFRNVMESLFYTKQTKKTQPKTESVNLGGNILLVEDNLVNQKVASAVIKKFGCKVDVASNGEEGLKMFSKGSYDFIFMDCQMPVLNGYESTRRIRKMEEDKSHVPVVAMTANAMEGDREKCIAAGMDDYVSKPIKQEVVSSVLTRFLDKG